MKNRLIFLLLFILPMCATAQLGFIEVYDDSIPDKTSFQDMLVDNDTIVLYSLAWDGNGKQGIRFYRIDTFGNIINEHTIYDTLGHLGFAIGRKKIITIDDGGYAVCGGIPVQVASPYLLKITHDLQLDFLKKYPSGNNSSGTSLVQMSDGGYMVLCWNADTPNNTQHPLIIRTDKNGQELWRKTYPEPDLLKTGADIKKISDNNFLVISLRADKIVFPDQQKWVNAYIFTVDSLGSVTWEWEANEADSLGWAWDCDFLDDGGMFCIGGTWEELPNSPGSYNSRPLIFRVDSDGDLVWKHVYGRIYARKFFRQMVKLPDDNYLVTGELFPSFTDTGIPTASLRGVHLKISPEGDSIWMRLDSIIENNTTQRVEIRGTGLLSSGSIVSMGTINKNTGPYGFLIKLSPNGCIDTLHCWPMGTSPIVEINRQQLSIYPNPASDFLTFSASSFFRKGAEIQVVDGLGRKMASIFPQGAAMSVDVGLWPVGIYFYRYLLDGQELDVGRFLVEE